MGRAEAERPFWALAWARRTLARVRPDTNEKDGAHNRQAPVGLPIRKKAR